MVDTCRERRLVLEPGASTPCLAEQLCARDALRQRAGRAGRVRPGVCYRLISASAFGKLPAATRPELEALPLESVVLQARRRGPFFLC